MVFAFGNLWRNESFGSWLWPWSFLQYDKKIFSVLPSLWCWPWRQSYWVCKTNIKKTWSVNKKIVVVFGFLLVFNVFYADAATAKTQRTIIDYEENLKTCDKIAKDFERGATFQQEKQKYGDTLALCYAGYIKIFNICLKGGNQRDYCNCYADEITQELKPLDEYYVECAIQGVEIDKAKQAQINKKIPSGDQIIKKAEKSAFSTIKRIRTIIRPFPWVRLCGWAGSCPNCQCRWLWR